MSKCAQALEPYKYITKKNSDSTSTVAEVIPLIVSLKQTLQCSSEVREIHDASGTGSDVEPESVIELKEETVQDEIVANQIVNTMKQIMQADIEKRFSFIESEDLYRVATYLDPRYKNELFSSSIITDQVKVTLARLCARLSR